ncbi:MAG: Eco57I restriction-modification methylase domain-containing protein [Smithella sp.]|nr:Eco57I restriction-modification methylase domain-containing protein [Smithella sp.]HQG66811.1 Eco57I restriction-modification methylase domain-containing protein [Smithella sp.]
MTNEAKPILEDIISDFAPEKFVRFFRAKSRQFKELKDSLAYYNDDDFTQGQKLGEIRFPGGDALIVCSFAAQKPLSERSGKKAQYDKAKKILKDQQIYTAGIFIFYDAEGNFRFSLVYPEFTADKKIWSNFRRFTYFVSREFTNKTFLKRIGDGDFSKLEKVKEAFAIGPVTDLFYKEFFVEYDKLAQAVMKVNKITEEKARDFVLLFAIRTIFLGFIQKRKWLGDNEKFIQHFFAAYQATKEKDKFYEDWLSILFFEALNHKFTPRKHLPAQFNDALRRAPYLNGGLFKEKKEYDEQGWWIPDKEISDFFDFLFSHSFTIEESSLNDAELQLNPEFLGIIFERLVNKADGAVYTPRTEVDLMCRLSLVQWLNKNLDLPVTKTNLYELFFREGEAEEDQKEGSFSKKEAREILDKMEGLAICDPAVGSGAFLVGMMQVMDETEQSLKARYDLDSQNVFERKKSIIAQSLYGVEVKEWAVWICQLRLWLSLFVEAPEEMRLSPTAILPSLEFKVRQGDSLVQKIGNKTFPVAGHANISKSVKDKVTKLKNLKIEYFFNNANVDDWEIRQRELAVFEEILQTEMNEKQQEIFVLKHQKRSETASLAGIDEIKPKQSALDFDKERIAELERQIEELKEQKTSIRKDKPLIWNIEFAEIFVEKEGFDIVIGNPPYVQKEDIADPLNKIRDKKEYKSCLQEMARLDFPEEFPAKKKIDAKSDLYTYFYIRALRLLNPKGIHTFICSNSWLDVGYGVWLQEFLLNRCPVEFIIDNHAKRSFEAADINTIISIIHAPRKKVDPQHLVKFVAFKKPFEEAIYTENLLAIENAEKTVSNKIFRVYPITVKELKDTGTEYESEEKKKLGAGKYEGNKWGGKYLRAPDFFLKLIEQNQNIKKISDICIIDGYVHDNNTGQSFPKTHFIKSVKNTRSINLKKNSDGVIMYGVKTEGNSRVQAPILMARTYGRDHLVLYNSEGVIGKEFYKIIPQNNDEIITIAVFCNSTFFILERELFGLTNLGGGGLKFSADDIGCFYIPNGLFFKQEKYLKTFFEREIETVFVECGIDPESKTPIEEQEPKPLPDRAELDKIVFDALGLTEDERKEVYRAVCRLVWNRISKARSV